MQQQQQQEPVPITQDLIARIEYSEKYMDELYEYR